MAFISLQIKASDLSEVAQTLSKEAPSGEAKALFMPLKIMRIASEPATIPKGN